jgi:hypothetical protein
MMDNKEIDVSWGGRNYRATKYEGSDEPRILDRFFFWKMTASMAGFTGDKRPQLPETFSEPFCCLSCDLLHNLDRSGPDAFRLDRYGNVESAIEIKATITKGGFTDVNRSLSFDELYWLSLASYDSLRYEIFKIHKSKIEPLVRASATARDRGTVNLQRVVDGHKLLPTFRGHIGIVSEKSLPSHKVR